MALTYENVCKARVSRKFKVVYTFHTQLDAPAPLAPAANSATAALKRPGPLANLRYASVSRSRLAMY
jgi:hypothetical protein